MWPSVSTTCAAVRIWCSASSAARASGAARRPADAVDCVRRARARAGGRQPGVASARRPSPRRDDAGPGRRRGRPGRGRSRAAPRRRPRPRGASAVRPRIRAIFADRPELPAPAMATDRARVRTLDQTVKCEGRPQEPNDDPHRERRAARRATLCDQLLAEHDPKTTPAAEFLGAQFDLGLGLGALPRRQRRPRPVAEAAEHDQRARRRRGRADLRTGATRSGTACARRRSSTHGSDAQKQRYLRPLFTGEEIWCQMFSEPGAGSDVAGLAMRAVQRRRRVDAQRSEGVDDARARVRVRHRARAHQSRHREAQGHDDVRHRHARARRRGAAARAGDGRSGVQRGLHDRRAHPRRRTARRRR